MYKLYDVVSLKADLPAAKLKAGTLGTVLETYPGEPPAYEVEFKGAERTFTMAENQLLPAPENINARPEGISA
jgi:Domain of unknown function (DUF4926)